jgi:hypothetical protein
MVTVTLINAAVNRYYIASHFGGDLRGGAVGEAPLVLGFVLASAAT